MVQIKDAAKKRVQQREDFLAKTKRELEQNTIRFAWVVMEHTPGYNTGGYYDTDVPAKNVMVSAHFDTEEEAQAWMDAHEADKGKSLHIQRRRLVRRVYEDWVWY